MIPRFQLCFLRDQSAATLRVGEAALLLVERELPECLPTGQRVERQIGFE